MTKTLDELAMEYAIVSLGVDHDRAEGFAELRPRIPYDEWRASEMKHRMYKQFDIYEVNQAIERALEIVKMVIPDKGDD